MRRAVGLAVACCLAVGACGGERSDGGDGRSSVVAGFYPLAEAARRVGGGRVEVVDLTPTGAEPHDLELSPDQVARVEDADVVVVLGGGFQPALEEAARRRDGGVVEVLPRVLGAGSGGTDPHVWLDPVLMGRVVEEVATALGEADAAGRADYRAGADAFRAELDALDRRYREGLSGCERRVVVTAHEAFGHLARRYGLEHEAVAVSPDAEPDPGRLDELAVLVRARGVTTVFTEALVAPEVAEALAREAGVATAGLDPLENSPGGGVTFVGAMDANLAALAAALGCPAARGASRPAP